MAIPSIDRLKSQLLTTGLQQKDYPLYQVINQLIDFLKQSISEIELQINGGGSGPSIGNQSFLTYNNDSAVLPNSAQLLPGSGITFNKIGNKLIININIPFFQNECVEGPEGMIGPPGINGTNGAIGPPGPSGPTGLTYFNEGYIEEIIDGILSTPVITFPVQYGSQTITIPLGVIIARSLVLGNSLTIQNGIISVTAGSGLIQCTSTNNFDGQFRMTNAATDASWLLGMLGSAGSSAFSIFNLSTSLLYADWAATTGLYTAYKGFALAGQSTPAALGLGNNNDYNPGNNFLLRLTPNALGSIITGISGGVTGRQLRIKNLNATIINISITQEDILSVAANRFMRSQNIGPGQILTAEYDGTATRWDIVSLF